jgi:hypothetical protein
MFPFFLLCALLLACHQPHSHSEYSPTDGGEKMVEALAEVTHEERDMQEIDPQQLSCEEAIALFNKASQNASRECQKDEDCIRLGTHGNCDCYQRLQGAGDYAKENAFLSSLHERIFLSSSNCLYYDQELLPCQADYTTGAFTLRCENNQCTSKKPPIDYCGSEKNP